MGKNISYQSWCIGVITELLKKYPPNTGEWEDIGYASIVKLLITHYADVYWCPNTWNRTLRGCQVNMWWTFSKANYERFFAPLLLSENARALVKSGWHKMRELKHSKEGAETMCRKLHFEHMTPVSYIFNKLKELAQDQAKISLESVERILHYDKIVVITKKEARYLDGKGSKFEENDFPLLSRLAVDEHEKKSLIEEFREVLSQSPRSKGSALLRMSRLHRACNTNFCYLHGESVLPIENWPEYFNSSTFELQ
ncbi:MAG: hypothetical protein PUE68_00965 [Kiritimatiellae bacterium]|nr:hypothetical protein [Kiritimatiellia bacterium]